MFEEMKYILQEIKIFRFLVTTKANLDGEKARWLFHNFHFLKHFFPSQFSILQKCFGTGWENMKLLDLKNLE